MTTTAEVQEAGLRWREHGAGYDGDAVAYLSSLEGPTQAEPWPAPVEGAGQPRQPGGSVSPTRQPDPAGAGKRRGLAPPAPAGPPAPPCLPEDGEDLCGQYPSRHAPRSAPCSLLQPPRTGGHIDGCEHVLCASVTAETPAAA